MADTIRAGTELAHILFMDIVGYSKNSTRQQGELRTQLRAYIGASETLRTSREGRVIQVETGDGAALAFFDHPASPLTCAIEITAQAQGRLPLRIGIHSGLIGCDQDVNGQNNLYGDGVNLAQRVMDCGSAGHILLSRQSAEILHTLDDYRNCLQDIGEYPVKHRTVHIYNFYDAAKKVGNAKRPASGMGNWLNRIFPGSKPEQTIQASVPVEIVNPVLETAPVLPTLPATTLKSSVVIIYKRNAEPDGHVLALLESGLRSHGYRVFIDRHLAVGIEWAQAIERELRSADFVITLLSKSSIRSDMMEHELQTAHLAAKPRLLPVRVNYAEDLPPNLSAILDPLQYTTWNSEQDDERVVKELIETLENPPARRKEEAIGGAVPLDSRYYVIRSTDTEFMNGLERQDSILLVKGARQMGKTSLLARGFQRARDQGAKVISTDFQSFTEDEMVSSEELMRAFCRSLKMQLELDVSIRKVWDDDFSPNQNLERFLRKHVLEKYSENIVWGLDEVDRLFGREYGSEVFGLFRSWHNKRATDPAGPWSRFTLAMAYATEAHLFISDLNQSPFNVGTRLTLSDFNKEQVDDLNIRCGSPLKSPEELSRFFALLGGHPYLSRRGLNVLETGRLSLEQMEQESSLDEGVFGDHLRRILVLISQDVEVLAGLRAFLGSRVALSDPVFYRMRSAGLMLGDSSATAEFRCSLYEGYLRRHLIG